MLKQIIIFGKTGKKSLMQEFANCFFPLRQELLFSLFHGLILASQMCSLTKKGISIEWLIELPPELKTLPQS